MKPPHSGGRLGAAMGRMKAGMSEDPNPTAGRDTLLIAVVFGLAWLLFSYFWPGEFWLNGKFLIVAVCFGMWSLADMAPRRWRWVAAFLRAAVMLFMLGAIAWISVDFISSP